MRPVGLVDCNNFYASCERLFQPRLRGRPVVVLSNNDGCVIARSNEAKALGIAMGAPWHLSKDMFKRHGVIVRSSNYTLYGDISRRVMRILSTFTPHLEIYSIDEAFLGLEGFGDRLEAHAREIRRTVLQWTGIPVSIGIAPTKTLAKAANRLAKQSDGVRTLMTTDLQVKALAQLKLTDLWGVASRMEKRLAVIGITSPLQLRDADPHILRQHVGVVMERMGLELRGVPCVGLQELVPQAKSIMCSRSFGRPVTTRRELEEAVSTYTERAAAKMRRQALATSTIQVFVTTNPFKTQEAQYAASRTITLPVATSDSAKLTNAAAKALAQLWRANVRYKKAGVILIDLVAAQAVQGDLWTTPDSPRTARLMQALDKLNAVYGRDTVTLASSGRKARWGLRAEKRSARYTTSWDELLRVV